MFSSLFSCSPTTQDLYNKAERLIDKKEYAKAIEIYNKIIRKNPGFQDAHYNKAWCYLQDSNFSKALDHFEYILRMKGIKDDSTQFIIEWNADSPFASEKDKRQIPVDEIYYQIAITKYHMDSLPVAYRGFQRCITKDYLKSDCLIWQGLTWVKAGENTKACELFSKAKYLSNDADAYIRDYCQ
ncbi:MAG TPA: tetratricopeptide repeat protein [Chitinophagaceae bacterium]